MDKNWRTDAAAFRGCKGWYYFIDGFFDMQGKNTNDFWLDAIRVYDPLGKDYTRLLCLVLQW